MTKTFCDVCGKELLLKRYSPVFREGIVDVRCEAYIVEGNGIRDLEVCRDCVVRIVTKNDDKNSMSLPA